MPATKEHVTKLLDGPLIIVGGEISDRQNILLFVNLIAIRPLRSLSKHGIAHFPGASDIWAFVHRVLLKRNSNENIA